MKLKYLLFFSLILLTCSRNNAPETMVESNLVLKATLKGQCFNPYSGTKECYSLVEAKLVNKTNKVFEFLVYSCATVGSIVTNSKDIVPLPVACSGNYPQLIKLKPNHEFVIPVILFDKSTYRIDYDTIKLGIILFNPKEIDDPGEFNDALRLCRESYKNVLWSDNNWLYGIGGETYEMRTIPDRTYNNY
jgi:hypothetical protein